MEELVTMTAVNSRLNILSFRSNHGGIFSASHQKGAYSQGLAQRRTGLHDFCFGFCGRNAEGWVDVTLLFCGSDEGRDGMCLSRLLCTGAALHVEKDVL